MLIICYWTLRNVPLSTFCNDRCRARSLWTDQSSTLVINKTENERTNFIRQWKRHWQVTSTGIGPSKLATKNKKCHAKSYNWHSIVQRELLEQISWSVIRWRHAKCRWFQLISFSGKKTVKLQFLRQCLRLWLQNRPSMLLHSPHWSPQSAHSSCCCFW